MPGSLLATPYPNADEWKDLLDQFSQEAIALKLLLSHIPYVFKDEPLKFALFRNTIAEAFDVEPSNVFIVGSAMAGRSLKAKEIDRVYSNDSDIDTLIVSEHLFTTYVMKSLAWVRDITRPDYSGPIPKSPAIQPDDTKYIGWLADNAHRGIWRPDNLPDDAEARQEFFGRFSKVSLKTLGLQLSDDTVAKVNGRIARSFDDAVHDLGHSIYRLRKDLEQNDKAKAAAKKS